MFRELPTPAESAPRGRLTADRHSAPPGSLAGRLFHSSLPRLILVTLAVSGCVGGGRPLGIPAAVAADSEAGDHPPAAKPPTKKSGSSKTSASRLFSEVTRTSVFGLEGQGSTFVYLFDRSGSMSDFEGRPLAAAKAELLKSLQVLRATNQFQIIFYNHELAPFNPYHPQPPRLMFGDERTKEQAEQFVRQIRANGGTRHVEPLKLALRLAPDVVFFLTDAAEPELTAQQLEEIARLNRGTVIQAIEFGVGPAAGRDNFMMKLARQSGGRYVYVDVTQLPNR
jgi:von Willebrand factor type A domain